MCVKGVFSPMKAKRFSGKKVCYVFPGIFAGGFQKCRKPTGEISLKYAVRKAEMQKTAIITASETMVVLFFMINSFIFAFPPSTVSLYIRLHKNGIKFWLQMTTLL